MNTYLLYTAGIDYKDGLNRFVKDEEVYNDALRLFIDNDNIKKLEEAIEAGNISAAYEYAHALKGESGTLSAAKMYKDILPLVEALKAGKSENIEEMFQKVKEDHNTAVEAIKSEIGI